MTDVERCAEALIQARQSGDLLAALPATPASVAEAHAVQDLVAAALDDSVGAFKAAAPPGEEPSRGLIFTRTIRQTPAQYGKAEAPHCGVEGEIAFRFTQDLPPRAAPYSREEVAAVVVALPALEVVAGRFVDPRSRPKLEQLADNTINAGLVLGPVIDDWTRLDMATLRVTLVVNDAPVLAQSGRHPTGDPLGVAVALANMMRQTNGVSAGQIVTTGSWTGLRFLQPGDRCTVRFDGLPDVEVAFVP